MMPRLEKAFFVLSSLWGVLRILLLRPSVIVFGNDRIGAHRYEPRMAKVYEWLESQNIPYANLIHSTPHGHVIGNWFRRMRPVVYLEGWEYWGRTLLSWLLQKSGAQHLWGIDDFRHWQTVIVAARDAGLQSTFFQHGRFTKHQQYLSFPNKERGDIQLPDRYVVWNDFWRERLFALSPPFTDHPKIVIAGGKPSQNVADDDAGLSRAPFTVLVIHEPAASVSDVLQYLEVFLSIPQLQLKYKVRRDRSVEEQITRLPLEMRSHDRFEAVEDIPDSTSLVVGSFSTLLYESIAHGLPVGVLRMSSTQAEDLVEEGLATMIDIGGTDMEHQIKTAQNISPVELASRAEKMRVTADIRETLHRLFYA